MCGPFVSCFLVAIWLQIDRELIIAFALIFHSFLFRQKKRRNAPWSLSIMLFVDYQFAIIHSLYLFLEGSLSGTQLNCKMLLKEVDKQIQSFITNRSHPR